MKAVVLASYDGERLRPFTFTAPAAMLPVLGRPLLEPLLDWLAKHGFDEIVVAVANFPRQIENYFRDGRRCGVRLAYSLQGERRGGANRGARFGSAAALRHLHARAGFFDQTVAVVSADLWTDLDLTAMLAAHRTAGASCSVALQPGAAPVGEPLYVAPGGRVSLSRETSAFQAASNTGVYLFEPHVLGRIPPDDAAGIERDLLPELLAARAGAHGYTGIFNWLPVRSTREYWGLLEAALRNDLNGFAPDYPEVCSGVRVGADVRLDYSQCRLEGPVWIGGGSVVEPGAQIIGPAWVGSGCVIGGKTRLEQCVVEDNTRLAQQLEFRRQVVMGNRAVNAGGDIEILVDAGRGDDQERNRRESDLDRESLLQLAVRVARR